VINYYGSGSVSKDLFYEQLVDSPPPVVSVDVETISLTEQIPIGFSIATSPHDAWYFRTLPEPDPEIEVVKNLLANPAIKKVFHNAIFDLRVFPLIFDGIDRCLGPKTKVLKADLTWLPIKDIVAGDKLIGIDEFPTSRVRKLRECIVEKKQAITLPAYGILMENGTYLTASGEHPWLVVRKRRFETNNRTNTWIQTKDLQNGDYIRNGFDLWETDTSYEGGYLAGFLDGEGSITATHNNTLALAQLPNKALGMYVEQLEALGIKHSVRLVATPKGKDLFIIYVYNQRDITRLLGSVRPKRLLDNLILEGKEPCDEGNLVKVASIVELGSTELISIQTSTKTFVAEGFFTHNSNIADTNVMARLCGHIETKLQVLTAELFEKFIVTAPDLLLRNNMKVMTGIPYEEVSEMCASHARATLDLYHHFIDRIDTEYFAVEMKVIPVLLDMSLRGMRVNQEDRARVEIKLKGEVKFYKELCAEEDFNPGSNQQVGYILAKRGTFLPFTRSKKQLKTDKETLGFVDDPLAAAVLSYRNAQKLLSTYIAPLKGEERIYTNYNLDAVVGRVSSSKMNMQNIPPRDMDRPLLPEGCRFIFEPDSGMFTTVDFSQEHLYILMHMAGDKQMERVFYEGEANGDIHLYTANEMRIPRRLAKTINYSMLYGATDKTISAHAKIRDLKRCGALRDSWFETFRDSAYWIKEAQEEGLRTGWAFPTLFGRRIRVPEEVNQWGRVDTEGMRRKAVNYPIIGTDGEIMKRALLICEREQLPIAVTVWE